MRNIELTFNNFYFSFYVFLHCSLGMEGTLIKPIETHMGINDAYKACR